MIASSIYADKAHIFAPVSRIEAMGGVPVLLLFAAIGVSYGWQPDGGGGVEYIIQVPPEQLSRLQETGEITSVIDPQVQGHVSRVVIKVGNDPLPRKTPSTISQLRHDTPVIASSGGGIVAGGSVETQARLNHGNAPTLSASVDANDQLLIPIPEMKADSQSNPIRGISGDRLAGNTAGGALSPPVESMMKPDSNSSSSGPGFSFPGTGLPQSLQDAANAAKSSASNEFNQATQDLSGRVQNGLDSAVGRVGQAADSKASEMLEKAGNFLRDNLAGNTSNTSPTPAPHTQNFTVPESNNNFSVGAATRTGNAGPTTEPTTTDRSAISMRDRNWKEVNTANVRPQGPSTDPVGATATSGTAGFGTTSTFGRLPDALSNPGTSNPRLDDSINTQSQDLAAERAAYDRQLAYQKQQQEYDLQQKRLKYEQEQYEREQYQKSLADRERQNQLGGNTAMSPSDLNPSGLSYGRSFGTENTATSALSNIDPRLSPSDAASLPPGAWSVDAYGRPIDRDGRLLDQYGRVISSQDNRVDDRIADRGPNASTAPLGAPSNYSSNSAQGTSYQASTPSYGTNQNWNTGAGNGGRMVPQVESSNVDIPSPSDRLVSTGSVGNLQGEVSRKTISPLFNLLFVVSMIGNIYLAVWLKKLRHQFHDLVASRRMGASGTTVAV